MLKDNHPLIVTHVVSLVNYLLRQLGDNGAVRVMDVNGKLYDDDVSTYHLCELLLQLDQYRYQDYINLMLGYYSKYSASFQNPFMLNALIIAGHKDSEFVEEAINSLLQNGRLPNGLFSMYTAYLGGGDHFSTLWAIKILALYNRNKYSDIIKSALDKCCEDYDVFAKNPSHLGFLLLDIYLSDSEVFIETRNRIIQDLLKAQSMGMWSDSAISTAYIVEDLLPYRDLEGVNDAITQAITSLFDLNRGKSDELPEALKKAQERSVESLFLQTLARTCLVGSMWLYTFHRIDTGAECVKNIVGQYSYLYNTSLMLHDQMKKLTDQVSTMEENFRHLDKYVVAFWKDSPFEKNVFVMMRYRNEVRFKLVEQRLREQFAKHGMHVFLARDKQIVDDLWDNISIYMRACKYGVAVFEQALERDFNPNVSLELGFMLSRGRRVLLLKEKDLHALPTDVVGKLYQEFDIGDPDSLLALIDKWVADVVEEDIKRA
jgi:hypothetical protein